MKQERELYAFRRHVLKCLFFGRRTARADKCTCPFHADGVYCGVRVRKSLATRSQRLADQKLVEEMKKIDGRLDAAARGEPGATTADFRRSIAEAVQRYLESHG